MKYQYDLSIGVHIEGVPGPAGSLKRGGAMFYYGHDPATLGLAGIGTYSLEPVLDAIPSDIASYVDPYKASYDLSSLVVSLAATPSVAKRLWATGKDPVGRVSQDHGGGQGLEINVPRADLVQFIGTYLFVGDETVYVDDVVVLTPTSSYFVLVRGVAGTVEPTYGHAPGTNIHDRLPYLENRVVTLWLFVRGTTAPQAIWRGLLVELATDRQQTVFELTANEMMSVLTTAKGAASPTSFKGDGRRLSWKGAELTGQIPIDDPASVDWVRSGLPHAYLRIGDSVVKAMRTGENFSNLWGPIMGSSRGEQGLVPADADIREVLVVDRLGKLSGNVAINSFEGLYGGLHPAAVALAFYLSDGTGRQPPGGRTFNILGSKWGLGLPSSLFDMESWVDMIDSTSQLTIDQMMLGYDGSFDFARVIKDQLLVPAGLYPAVNHEGKIGLFKLETFNVDMIVDVLARRSWSWLTPTRIDMDAQVSKSVRSLSASFGELPHVEADTIVSRTLHGNRTDYGTSSGGYEFDYSLYYRENADGGLRLNVFIAESARRQRTTPVLHCSMPLEHDIVDTDGLSGGGVPGIGSLVIVKGGPETGMLGPDGERIQPGDSDILFMGILIGRSIRLQDRTVDCEILMTNYERGGRAARVIAPAGRIESYTGSFPPRVVLTTDYRSMYDTTGFMVGDQVRVWTKRGRPYLWAAKDLEITAIDESTRTLQFSHALLKDGEDHATAITHGLHIRLSPRSVYSNGNWPGSTFYKAAIRNRRFAYIGTAGESDDILDRYT